MRWPSGEYDPLNAIGRGKAVGNPWPGVMVKSCVYREKLCRLERSSILFPSGVHPDGIVGAWVVGNPLRDAARGRHSVYIDIAVVLAGEGDGFTIRREDRVVLDTRAGREPRGVTALAADGPQIARVREDDLRAVHGRVMKQV